MTLNKGRLTLLELTSRLDRLTIASFP